MFVRAFVRRGLLRTAGYAVVAALPSISLFASNQSTGSLQSASQSAASLSRRLPIYDVFISHADEESEVAESLTKELKKRGVRAYVNNVSSKQSDTRNEAVTSSPVGVFLLSATFLKCLAPTSDAAVFLERYDNRDPVRIVGFALWSGSYKSAEVKKIGAGEKAETLFGRLTKFSGIENLKGDAEVPGVPKLADSIAKIVAGIDAGVASQTLATGHISNVSKEILSFGAPQSTLDSSLNGIADDIFKGVSLKPRSVLRHVLCNVSISNEETAALGVLNAIKAKLQEDDPRPAFSLEWKLQADSTEGLEEDIVELGHALGLRSQLSLLPTSLAAQRVVRMLADLPVPWALVVSPVAIDPVDLDEKQLCWPDATKSSGLVLATFDGRRFPTRVFWNTHNASGGLQDGSVDIAREVMDLRTIQQRRLYKNGVATLAFVFDAAGHGGLAGQGDRLDAWAADLSRAQKKKADSFLEADKDAHRLDDYRRHWVLFFRRLQALCEIGKVSPADLKAHMPDISSSIITFLQVCEPMDEANLRVVIKGLDWEGSRPRVYAFVQKLVVDLGDKAMLEAAGVQDPVPVGGPKAKVTSTR